MFRKLCQTGAMTVQIAAYIATCTFSDGARSYLRIMRVIGINMWGRLELNIAIEDQRHFSGAEHRTQEVTREGRLRKRHVKLASDEAVEEYSYGPGADELWLVQSLIKYK
ncbi:hypothetical protein J437_LFUL012233 [Ladona fulva]|uniref:Uncharacterized protein n=1 Tax=Ladona fulva TaxID=123851 RepID=A0A8K0P3D0_LADFU|nr:hypothetical protein J437_LFUL012233 [Ladona fulva]